MLFTGEKLVITLITLYKYYKYLSLIACPRHTSSVSLNDIISL